MVWNAFGTYTPTFAEYPNVIFQADYTVFHLLSEMTHCVWANVWDFVPYDAQGDDLDINISRDFSLWNLPPNREWVLNHLYPYACFVLRIPADTPQTLVEQIRNNYDREKMEDFDVVFDVAIQYIDVLKYAWCIFDHDVYPGDVIIASPEHAEFIQEFTKRMAVVKREARPLKKVGGKIAWPY